MAFKTIQEASEAFKLAHTKVTDDVELAAPGLLAQKFAIASEVARHAVDDLATHVGILCGSDSLEDDEVKSITRELENIASSARKLIR